MASEEKVPSEAAEAAVGEKGKSVRVDVYLEMTTGQKDHDLEPPHTYVFGGMVTSLYLRGGMVGMKTAKDWSDLMQRIEAAPRKKKSKKCVKAKYCRKQKMYDRDLKKVVLATEGASGLVPDLLCGE